MKDKAILSRFLDLSGSEDSKILIIPIASMLDDTGTRYKDIFEKMGGQASVLPDQNTSDAEELDRTVFENCTGIFMTGGNQLRLSTILGGLQLQLKCVVRMPEVYTLQVPVLALHLSVNI